MPLVVSGTGAEAVAAKLAREAGGAAPLPAYERGFEEDDRLFAIERPDADDARALLDGPEVPMALALPGRAAARPPPPPPWLGAAPAAADLDDDWSPTSPARADAAPRGRLSEPELSRPERSVDRTYGGGARLSGARRSRKVSGASPRPPSPPKRNAVDDAYASAVDGEGPATARRARPRS